ncbi:MAG: NfeD family protein, partial [Desulfomicrobium sp.]|nr:NfeD family protein [Desulfomicrobium sp.]
ARSLRRPRQSVRESMAGLEAEAIQDFMDGFGRVHLRGEDWSARCDHTVRKGDTVRVITLEDEGLVLSVTLVQSGNGNL